MRETGEREVLGYDIGQAESYEFWSEFLRHLVSRGMKGVKLVISDAHEGLKLAIAEILAEASWERCRVHFMRTGPRAQASAGYGGGADSHYLRAAGRCTGSGAA